MNKTPKILIVDDQKVNRVLIKRALKKKNYDLMEASTGEEALSLIEEDDEIDLILLDIMMPGIDGFEVLDEIKSNSSTKDIKVIMLSAMIQVGDKVRALSSGASDYITKPFEREEVIERIDMQLSLKRADEDLKKIRARYESLFESANEIIFTTDTYGFLRTVNRQTEEIMGYSKEELIGKNAIKFAHPGDWNKYFDMWREIKRGEGPVHELKMRTKNKDTIHVLATGREVLVDGRVVEIQYNAQDITKLKKLEKEIEQKNEEYRAIEEKFQKLNLSLENKAEDKTSVKMKDNFVIPLIRELKTLLTPLNILLSMMKKDGKDLKSKKRLNAAIINVNRTLGLVEKTMHFSRLDSSSVNFEIVDIDLTGDIDKIIEANQSLFDKNNISVENLVDEKITVRADEIRLEELFDNLFSNAVKHCPKEGGKITIDATEEDDGFVTISVNDNGIGMTKEETDLVFNEFYKSDSLRHDNEGYGLGLSVCKRIVEMHGGKMWAESPGPGRGTTVYFTILKKSKIACLSVPD